MSEAEVLARSNNQEPAIRVRCNQAEDDFVVKRADGIVLVDPLVRSIAHIGPVSVLALRPWLGLLKPHVEAEPLES